MGLGILAAEATKHLDLIGRLRGYFIVVFAVGLFCGSIYLVLSTDLGSRLGFLVSFAALSGFLMMLGLIWFTNLTPLNALHGPPPHWLVKEVVDNPAQAKTEKARTIDKEGTALDSGSQGEIKATVDSAVTAEGGEFKQFSTASDYVVVKAEKVGGGSLAFFRHRPQYAVMEIREAKKVEALPGAAPPAPSANPAKAPKYVVLERNLGAMRQPPLVMSTAFGILFALSIYLMHNMERSEQKAKAARTARPAARRTTKGRNDVPVLAQQLIDASHDGDLAFMAFAFMCFVFVGLLFAIDKVRKRTGGGQ